MAKTDFPIFLLDTIAGDIFGLSNQNTGEVVKKGLKDKLLPFDVKQQLKRFGTKVTEEVKLYRETVQELVKDFKINTEEVTDELKKEFQEKIAELNKTIISIEHFDFKSSHFTTLGAIEEDYTVLDYIIKDEPTNANLAPVVPITTEVN